MNDIRLSWMDKIREGYRQKKSAQDILNDLWEYGRTEEFRIGQALANNNKEEFEEFNINFK